MLLEVGPAPGGEGDTFLLADLLHALGPAGDDGSAVVTLFCIDQLIKYKVPTI